MTKLIDKIVNHPTTSNLVIFGLIGASLAVFMTQYPYNNPWVISTGVLLWLLAVATAKIEELCKKKSDS